MIFWHSSVGLDIDKNKLISKFLFDSEVSVLSYRLHVLLYRTIVSTVVTVLIIKNNDILKYVDIIDNSADYFAKQISLQTFSF